MFPLTHHFCLSAATASASSGGSSSSGSSSPLKVEIGAEMRYGEREEGSKFPGNNASATTDEGKRREQRERSIGEGDNQIREVDPRSRSYAAAIKRNNSLSG